MQGSCEENQGKPFFGYMTSKGPVVISHPILATMEAFKALQGVYTSSHESTGHGGDDNMERRITLLEADVAHIKNDISDTKASVTKIDSTVNSIDKNMAVVLEKLDRINESLSKKPSIDAVDKKISDAKLAILLGVPAIIAVGTAVIKYASKFIS